GRQGCRRAHRPTLAAPPLPPTGSRVTDWLAALARPARGDAAKTVHDALARGLELPGYRLLELIGAGGQGAVVRATDLGDMVDSALKLMPCAPGDDDET